MSTKLARERFKRDLFLIVFGILGVLITTAIFPSSGPVLTVPPEEPLIVDKTLPIPPIHPRKESFNPFDQAFLFELNGTDKLSGEEREVILQAQYQRILGDLQGQEPKVEINHDHGMTVISINDQSFVTVLPSDAPDYYARLSDERKHKVEMMIAQKWKRMLEYDLYNESRKRSPQSLAQLPFWVAIFFFCALIFHGLADGFARKFLNLPGWSLKTFVWLSFLSASAYQYPVLKPVGLAIVKGGLRPIFFFLLVTALCIVVIRAGSRSLESFAKDYIDASHRSGPEIEQRVHTMLEGGRFLVRTVVIVGGFILFMSSVGLDIGKLFAGAGVAGIALGVIGKDILIDYFYGVNILLDDQLNIGDYIETPVASGTVEKFNLRTTRIRETDGGLSIVTNGQLTFIKNHSREFANADFRIGVAYGSHIENCFTLIREEIKKLAEEQPGILDAEPALTGVDELGDSAVVLRALVRTKALSRLGS